MKPNSLLTRKSTLLLVMATLWFFCLPVTAHTDKKTETDTSKPENSENSPETSTNEEEFDFSSTGRPGNQTAGDNRGSCPNVNSSLTAMIPDSNFGQTITAYPRFWVYMPYYDQQVSQVEFVLQDNQEQDIWRSQVTIPHNPGYISFSLPKNQPPLAVGKSYQWYVKVNCDPDLTTPPLYVKGWIKRINLNSNLYTKLKNQPEQSHIIYASHGIWYDAIDQLLSLYISDSHDLLLQQDWENLLNAKGITLQLPKPPYHSELVKDY